MFQKIVSGVVLGLGLAISAPVVAVPSLIGDTITADYLFPNFGTVFSTSTVVVGGGVEITCPGDGGGGGICSAFAEAATIDIGSTSILLNEDAGAVYSAAAFNGINFTGLDFGAGFSLTGFVLTTNLAGLDAGDISFTSDSIAYNAQGLSFVNAPYFIRLDLIAVPEPASLALLGLGLAVLGFSRRKQA